MAPHVLVCMPENTATANEKTDEVLRDLPRLLHQGITEVQRGTKNI